MGCLFGNSTYKSCVRLCVCVGGEGGGVTGGRNLKVNGMGGLWEVGGRGGESGEIRKILQ